MTAVLPAAARGVLPAQRLLAPGGSSYADHLRVFGPLPEPADLVREVERSGLTGRGGAAFPAGRKLAATAPGGVVIGNGSEGEPLSAKDRLLLQHRPHLVLDGLLAAARALDARLVHLVVAPGLGDAVEAAVRERRDARRVVVTETEERFVSGEASAVVNLLTKGRAIPVDRTVRLTERGLRRRPTLVQNVETLAHIALIARHGAAAFRSAGTAGDPGTRLLTITGDVARPGVVEVAGGTALRDALAPSGPDGAAGVLVGGYHGAWTGPEALDRPLSVPGEPGSIPVGAGVLIVVGEGTCGLRAAAEVAAYLAGETAGQCGPCVNGLPVLAGLLERVALGDPDPRLPATIEETLRLVEGRGACHHPDGTARMVASAMRVFSSEVQAHRAGRCGAVR